MNDGFFRAAQGLEGFADQRLARLRQHLDSDIIGNALLFHQQADEVVFNL